MIELPDTLTQQFRERQIPEKEIEAVVLATFRNLAGSTELRNG